MGYNVGSGAWHKTYSAQGGCPGPQAGTRVGRKRKKKSGRSYHHYCVAIEIDANGNVVGRDNEVGYNSSKGGHHPCKGLGKSTFLGGGTESHGHWVDYTGKAANFYGAEFAFKCEVPNSKVTAANLKTWSGSDHMNGSSGAAAKQSGTRKTLWEQLVMGVDVPGVQGDAFCKKVENLPAVIHTNGTTCYNKIDATLQATNRKLYCAQNETDERCACRNISHYGTKRCIEEKSTLPGCNEVKAGFDKYPAKAVTEFNVKTFTPTCFAQGICSRDGQFLPDNQPDVCSQTIAICKQDVNLYGDITGGAVNVDQSMDCSASSTNTPSSGSGEPSPAQDEVEAARAALARGDPGAQERLDAARDALDEGESPVSFTDFRTNPRSYIPNSLDGLKTNRKQQLGAGGVGGVFMMMCCCLVVLLLLSSGGGGPAARRFSR